MKRKLLRIIRIKTAAILGFVSLSACNDPVRYTPPAVSESQPVATIEGSKIYDGGLFKSDILFIPTRIDGKFCGNIYYNDISSRWHKEFLVSPGQHKFLVIVSIGGTFSSVGEGGVSIDATLKPGETYHIRGIQPSISNGAPQSAVWIEDDQGNPITDRYAALINLYSGGNMIAVPMGAGKTPMFVP